jgi:prepilin-type N-terminal cleavage/methylation domain-containing protein
MARNGGFTLVELLIVTAMLGTILSLLVSFFVKQAQLTHTVQARNEVQSKIRGAAEALAQDLQMAGSSVVFTGNGVVSPSTCSATGAPKCLSTPSGSSAFLRVYYATSLRASDPCRRVEWSLAADKVLRRSDVACDKSSSFQPYANDLEAVTLDFVCADRSAASDPEACYDRGSFPQQATVTVVGRSERKVAGSRLQHEQRLTVTMPNLKDR